MTTLRQIELWPGPLRPTRPYHAIYSVICVGVLRNLKGEVIGPCKGTTINGESFCYACKDPNGYTKRLRQAQIEARQRCLEAYQVCKHCGRGLTPEAVKAGETAHRIPHCWTLMHIPD